MKSILNQPVSIYRNIYDSVGTTIDLLTFLKSTRHRDKVESLRQINNKVERNKLKTQLPAVTVSGVFHPTRKTENLVQHSGLICLDVDGQDNKHIEDFGALKERLKGLPEIAYCGFSASGKGLFLIIPLAFPERHREQFTSLLGYLKSHGVVIDSSCKDVCRLRGYSLDDDPYINERAVKYEGVSTPVIRSSVDSYSNRDDTICRVSELCRMIDEMHIDLTTEYKSWFAVCASFASLGEHGRPYFHIVSRQNDKYDECQTNKKFSNLLKGGDAITIATFFNMCKENGVFLRNRFDKNFTLR